MNKTNLLKPKVLIIISSARVGGPGKGLIQFLSQCKTSDMDYTLCTFTHKGKDNFSFAQAIRAAGLNLHILEQKSVFDTKPIKEVAQLIKNENYNIIQTHEYKSHTIGFITSLVTSAKWVTWAHGWTNENIKIKCYNLLEKFFHFFSSAAIGVSPKLFNTLKKIRKLRRNTKLILNAVDEAGISFGNKENLTSLYRPTDNAFLIGIFGRFSPEKGQDLAVEALAQIHESYPQIKLLLVGEGQDQEKLEDIARKRNVSEKILFAGYQSFVGDFFKLVDLTLLPSRSEGLPNVVLESMVLHTPVLATDVGGVKEIIHDHENGWVCPAFSASEIAEKLSYIMEHQDEFAHAQSICRNSLFPKFDVSSRKNNILNMYKELIHG